MVSATFHRQVSVIPFQFSVLEEIISISEGRSSKEFVDMC